MQNSKLMLAIVMMLSTGVSAQVANVTHTDSLKEKAGHWDAEFKAEKNKADKWAADRNLDKKLAKGDGLVELVRYDKKHPFYFATANANAAITVSTSRVWPGGPAGFNLSGSGQLIGEWDGGAVRTTHRELTGRAHQIDLAALSNHSTHVAGTMIASGVDPAAKGMAFQAELNAYDWLNQEAEMALAAADGLTLSNHSYTHATGWIYNLYGDGYWVWMGDASVSPTEDYFFGLYTMSSRNYDDISFQAPYYLIVKAAGNDWADAGPAPGMAYWYYDGGDRLLSTLPRDADGPWDCIPDDATSKNILTVGAIDDILDGDFSPTHIAARTSPLTAWGPVDDGRIKPDIVTNGVGLYSSFASGDAAYYSMNGTSTAAACASGSLALLQQHYRATHSSARVTAAALKALVLHTARESGANDGPDYCAGWGLLNTDAAAQVISQDEINPIRIQELALNDGAAYALRVRSAASETLKTTICWTDPPGTPEYSLNPATPMLVNDLDLRITRLSDNQITLPWRLNRALPTAAATRGDNSVDNVEQVQVPTPMAGDYLISVSHKGSLLHESQNFAMVITGADLATFLLNLTVAGNGTVDRTPDRSSYDWNESVQLHAVPAPGWQFLGWTGGLNCYDNPASIAMDSDKNITATFTPIANPAIDTRLQYISNDHDAPLPGLGTLVIDVAALSSDGQSHAIDTFQGSFLLDPTLRARILDVSFSNQFFPAIQYGDRLESYETDLQSPNHGRVFYRYALSSGAPLSIDDQLKKIVTVVIHYQMSPEHGHISWNDGVSDFRVIGEIHRDLTGVEEPLTLEFDDITVPVELSRFEASDTGKSVQLTWTTQSEKENLGFHLYRSDRADGPYAQISSRLIPGAGSSETTRQYSFEDLSAARGHTYFYKVADVDYNGRITLHGPVAITVFAPDIFAIEQNYPNPFNPSTQITFSLPRAGKASLVVFNLQGQVIRTLLEETCAEGWHSITWDGMDNAGQPAPSGIYFYTLRSEELHKTRRMQLVK